MSIVWVAIVMGLALVGSARGAETQAVQKYLERRDFQWTCVGGRPVRVCSDYGLDSAAAEVQREAGESLARITRLAGVEGYQRKPLIYLFLVGSTGRLRRLINAYANGASEPKDHAIFLVKGHPEILTHELSHEVLTNLWGKSEAWIAEGLAVHIAGPDDPDIPARALLANGYLPLAKMVTPKWTAHLYPSTKIYPELGSFVKYLDTTYGMAKLKQIWRAGSRGLPQVYGKTLAQLESDWRARLSSRGAVLRFHLEGLIDLFDAEQRSGLDADRPAA